MQDFERGERLGYQQQREDVRRDRGDRLEVILLVVREKSESGADGACCPEGEVEEVVEEKVCPCKA